MGTEWIIEIHYEHSKLYFLFSVSSFLLKKNLEQSERNVPCGRRYRRVVLIIYALIKGPIVTMTNIPKN